jgi:ABC-type amino acid transport substrate-binding protein
MMRQLFTSLAATAFALTAACAEDLKVCMNEDAPPYSVYEKNQPPIGFDVLVAQSLAKHLGRELKIKWFESKREEDSSLFLESNALLMDGQCDWVAGYPLIEDMLGQPGMKSFRLPDFHGAVPADRRRRIPMGSLIASRAYHRSVFVAISNHETPPIHALSDLKGLRLVVEGGTFVDAVLMSYQSGLLIDDVVHIKPGQNNSLASIESGESDATLVSLHKADLYLRQHPKSRIKINPWRYPDGINFGWVTLPVHQSLLVQVNQQLQAMLESGEIRQIAEMAGMTYVAPVAPNAGPAPRLNR